MVFLQVAVAAPVCPGWPWRNPAPNRQGEGAVPDAQEVVGASVAHLRGGLGVILAAGGWKGPGWVSVAGAQGDLHNTSFKKCLK